MDVAFYHSASARLLVPLLLTIVVVVSVYGFLGFRAMSQEWNESVYSYAQKFGELAKSATKHGMLVNRKDDVQYVVQLIGDSPGVEALNIYNKQGRVAFSHDPKKIGQQVDMQAEACVVCHEKGAPLKAVDTENRTRVYRNSQGRRVFGVIVPDRKRTAVRAGRLPRSGLRAVDPRHHGRADVARIARSGAQ